MPLNPKVLARMAKDYINKEDDMCPKCGGSLKCCHQEDKENDE
jgi:hypothetical protein